MSAPPPLRATAKPARPRRAGTALGHAMPRSYEELRAVLSSGSAHLPKRLRQVAIFLWQHPHDVALGSISSVARQVGVQPSTLVRFAQLFGYSGFSDFQDIFKDYVKANWPSAGRGAGGSNVAEAGRRLAVAGPIAAARASLARLETDFDAPGFANLVDVLASARCIHLIGSKRAFPVAVYLSLTFSQFGLRTVLIDNIGSTAFDQIACLDEGDVVLAISFSPYNSITPDLVAAASQHGARIAAITDSAFSPLLAHAGAHVEIIETSHAGFRSVAATFALAMALALAVAKRREDARP